MLNYFDYQYHFNGDEKTLLVEKSNLKKSGIPDSSFVIISQNINLENIKNHNDDLSGFYIVLNGNDFLMKKINYIPDVQLWFVSDDSFGEYAENIITLNDLQNKKVDSVVIVGKIIAFTKNISDQAAEHTSFYLKESSLKKYNIPDNSYLIIDSQYNMNLSNISAGVYMFYYKSEIVIKQIFPDRKHNLYFLYDDQTTEIVENPIEIIGKVTDIIKFL